MARTPRKPTTRTRATAKPKASKPTAKDTPEAQEKKKTPAQKRNISQPPEGMKKPRARKAVSKKPTEQKTPEQTVNEFLDKTGEEKIISLIFEGNSFRQMGRMMGINPYQLSRWVHKDVKRSARAKQALEQSAAAEDDLALEEIEKLGPESTKGDIARAREIAQHRRWRAKVRNPNVYGDKVAIDASLAQSDTDGLVDELKEILGVSSPSEGRKPTAATRKGKA